MFFRHPGQGICRLSLCLSLLVLAGCFPQGTNPLDEQKDPHFLKGKRRESSMDYKGAIEAYNKAVEANPRSAAAHKSLGLLYYQREKEFAAAIYHFQKLLELSPEDEHADTIREFIQNCKQELASQVLLTPVNQEMQRYIERIEVLSQENETLKTQISRLEARLAAAPGGGGQDSSPPSPPHRTTARTPAPGVTPLPNRNPPPTVSGGRTRYSIKPNDSLYSLAQRYHTTVDAIKRANPGVDPARLQIDQALWIPTP